MRRCGGTRQDGYQCQRRHWLDSDDRCKDHPVYLDMYDDWQPSYTTPSVKKVPSVEEMMMFFYRTDRKKTPAPTPQRILVDVSNELIIEESHDRLPPVKSAPQIDCASIGKLLDDTREKLHDATSRMQLINEDIASLRASIQLYACMTTLGAGGDLAREIKRFKEELANKCDKLSDLSADIARFQRQLRSFTTVR